MRRVLLILIVALGLSPGLVWRSPVPEPDFSQRVILTRLAVPKGEAARIGSDGPVVTGAWRLSSPNSEFGSYSALVAPGGNMLLAISDHGQFLRFPMPGSGPGATALGTVLPGSDQYKTLQDMESATRDPATGRIWLGLEFRQGFVRLDKDLANPESVSPPQMQGWRSNSGPEAMVRLADGRFVVLAEAPLEWSDATSPGLLFPGDPLGGEEAMEFRFAPPAGYNPSDMVQLPDGRVLILLRGLKFLPPGFTARMVMADPAEIRAGGEWPWQDVGELASSLPIDNYEGIAVTGGENGGPLTLWLISDDNGARLLQRTLLLRLEWRVPPRP